MKNTKVVLIIGAGATVADVYLRPTEKQPPLDKKFFSCAKSSGSKKEVDQIESYFSDNYHMDIMNSENDSLEKIMMTLYSDIFDPNLSDKSLEIFRLLIHLFNKRLADTTNNIEPTQNCILYQIVKNYLDKNVKPNNIMFITFNQDLQIEKILHEIKQAKDLKTEDIIFNFPTCYLLNKYKITAPKGKVDVFDVNKENSDGIKILKLHGSLNWYSKHRSQNLNAKQMFKPDRNINISKRKNINPSLKYSGSKRTEHTFPIIVPPVNHKSAIIHNEMRKLWSDSEVALKEADEIIIYGYSCPITDFESSNLILRSLKDENYVKLSIIDPNPNTLKRYVELIKPKRLSYYCTAKEFLLTPAPEFEPES